MISMRLTSALTQDYSDYSKGVDQLWFTQSMSTSHSAHLQLSLTNLNCMVMLMVMWQVAPMVAPSPLPPKAITMISDQIGFIKMESIDPLDGDTPFTITTKGEWIIWNSNDANCNRSANGGSCAHCGSCEIDSIGDNNDNQKI